MADLEQIRLWLPDPEGPSYRHSPIGPRGLEIGGGPHARRLGFIQFDAIDWSERTGLSYDLGDARQLPYEDGSFDHVYSSNLLEHFSADDTTDVLIEWTRVLHVGGLLELIVPDTMGIMDEYFAEPAGPWSEYQERLLGSGDYEGNQHRAAFTISSVPRQIALVPGLDLLWCNPSHRGCGIWALASKEG